MDNGYNKSLFASEDGIDYITKQPCDTCRHEIFNASNRQNSKADGLWIAVSPEMHERIHRNVDGVWDMLKRKGEVYWLMADWDRSINDFVNKYGKNYL